MQKFYFTYGGEGYDYAGGWTEVEAPDYDAAEAAFNCFHPRRDGFIACAFIYPEADFKATRAFREGNFGARCHERIRVTRDVLG